MRPAAHPSRRGLWPLLTMRSKFLARLRKARRALLDVGAHSLELIGRAHQLHLLHGFGKQRRTWIDGQIVEHALAGTDRIGALARDLAREFEGRSAWIVADARRKAVAQGFLRGEDAPGVGQLAQNIVADET